MKESEFIELLNLYVDHEIGAEDAVRLEAEVASNPARREVYRQYCRIHKACTLMADQFRELAPEAKPLPARRPALHWAPVTAAAGLALAACVAVFLSVNSRTSGPGPSASQAPAAGQPETVAIASNDYPRELVPVLAVRDFSQSASAPASEGLVAVSSQNRVDPLAWIQRLQLPSIRQTPAVRADFKPNAALPGADVRSGRSPDEEQAPAEMAAFRFER